MLKLELFAIYIFSWMLSAEQLRKWSGLYCFRRDDNDTGVSFSRKKGYMVLCSSIQSDSKKRSLRNLQLVYTHRILLVIEPEWWIRINSLLVVAIWKYDCFSLTKNVSGTHMFLMNSEPTDNVSTPARFLYAKRGSVQNCRK